MLVTLSYHVSYPNILQMFDSKNRCNRGLLDVTHQNKVTGRDKNKKLSYIDVQHFKVCNTFRAKKIL